ncbi:antibiotic resistance protein VanZ [Roseibium aestuarii]|uniref:Antibiotic resistance protein VanZ n=1 Tax=Roseibium aestuarii TaxID=2600299 RepID=A0ABW4K201_9HYPH|nr:antibiotic resistance protein VanZ [Roseibium aestuarii]
MRSFRLPLPVFFRKFARTDHVDIEPIRLVPLTILLVVGALLGLVFNTGVGHPYDKIIHISFYAMLTLSIHVLFNCRLRISAVTAFGLGVGGEIAQAFVPHHEASFADAFANGVGVALIVAAIALRRSEEKQAVKQAPVEVDYRGMGLEPVKAYISSAPDSSSSRSSEK